MKEIKIDYPERQIVIAKKIAKKAMNPFTAEGKALLAIKNAFPDYEVVLHSIEKNAGQEHYKGLTYDYMEKYILEHEPEESKDAVYGEYMHMREIAECHSVSKRYPTIKSWFLGHYREILEFGEEETDPMEAELRYCKQEPMSKEKAA